ncbi:unnamed protein product [Dracunculus medinensis]|uniref:Uncharacterized protein n=1 Tax=Dracunculus medinensis TaxID=318479 RepID=A0A0N4UK72_DRAME|nr:unnamed protein product [Dracunculus medinensis]
MGELAIAFMPNMLITFINLLYFIDYSEGGGVNIVACSTGGATPRPTIPPEYCQDSDPACPILFPLTAAEIEQNLNVLVFSQIFCF